MTHRVTLYSFSGDAMIYMDYETLTEARKYAEWAESTLPCTALVKRDGLDACNDNRYLERIENELGSDR